MSASARENISLQFGEYSNYVGSHFWNANSDFQGLEEEDIEQLYYCNRSDDAIAQYSPRVLVFDLRGNLTKNATYTSFKDEEDIRTLGGIWDQGIDIVRNEQYSSQTTVDTPSLGSSISNWTDILKTQLSSKSFCEVPLFSEQFNQSYFGQSKHNFSSFLSGRSRDIISTECRDAYFDSFRYMLEECNSIGSISVSVDFDSGFGGLACDFLADIREECPHTSMNVWAFGDPISSVEELGSIHALSLPFMYKALCPEVASVIIPVDKSRFATATSCSGDVLSSSIYLSSSLAAALLDAITSSDRRNSHRATTSTMSSVSPSTDCDWVRLSSCNGSFPIVSLEGCLPWRLNPLDNIQPLLDTFNSPSLPQQNNNLFELSTYVFPTDRYNHKLLNPFMRCFSLTRTQCSIISNRSSISSNTVWTSNTRAFSNFISFRTPVYKELTSTLFYQCLYSKYMISHVSQRDGPVYLPSRSITALEMETTRTTRSDSWRKEESNDLFPCPVAAAVGADDTIGKHLQEVAKLWIDSAKSSRVILEKSDIGTDEVKDVHQSIMELAERYLNT